MGTEYTRERFASGEMCYLLNGSQSEDVVWRQTLGTDSIPVLNGSHAVVYHYLLNGHPAYSNTAFARPQYYINDKHDFNAYATQEGDIHLTLTYREAPKYDRAKKDIRNFLLKVKRLREKRGLEELKYAGTIEENEEGRKVRIHAHILMNGGIDREELEEIWEKGLTNVFGLQPDERGLEGIARYVTKQQKNQKKWFRSRNLKKPERRTSDTKVSTRRVKRISLSFGAEAKEILEKVYPGYRFVQCTVHYSDVVDGVYIRAVMRRLEDERQ
jgi:hypothetical protein